MNNQEQNNIGQNINNQPIQVTPQPETINQTPPERTELKQVEIKPNQKKESNIKYILTVLLFIVLFVMVIFLPNISEYINVLLSKNSNTDQEISTGTLKCTLTKNDSDYDYTYTALYDYTDNKLKKSKYEIETRGNGGVDDKNLNDLYNNCELLKKYAANVDGLSVNCNIKSKVFTKEEIVDYNTINKVQIDSSFAEMGGTYPEYELDYDINKVETIMKNSKYTCTKIK